MQKCLFAAIALAAPVVLGAGAPYKLSKPAQPTGGMVERQLRTRLLVIRNEQTKFSSAELAEAVDDLRCRLFLPLVLVRGDAETPEAGATVTLTDAPSYGGATLLAAPEQGWSRMSVDWLLADGPDAEKRERRLTIELMRAICAALGLGYSMYQPDVMTYVASCLELDGIKGERPNPETENNLLYGAKHRGIKRLQFATYLTACQEGWAPQPTNDVQKAIWQKVHEVPSKPLKIKYDANKQPEK